MHGRVHLQHLLQPKIHSVLLFRKTLQAMFLDWVIQPGHYTSLCAYVATSPSSNTLLSDAGVP